MCTLERNILIAMDESHHSEYAFQYYMKNVYLPKDHVTLLFVPNYHTVIESPMVMTDVTTVTDHLKGEEHKIKGFLEQMGQKLKASGIGGKIKSVGGNPGEVIVRVAEEEKVTLIIMGTRGLGKIQRTLLGSVSTYVMNHSNIPLLVCKQHDSAKK